MFLRGMDGADADSAKARAASEGGLLPHWRREVCSDTDSDTNTNTDLFRYLGFH